MTTPSFQTRPLAPDDAPAALALLRREPELNLFMLGDLERLGIRSEHHEFIGAFTPAGHALAGVLMRFIDSIHCFVDDAAALPALVPAARHWLDSRTCGHLLGISSLIDELLKLLGRTPASHRRMHFACQSAAAPLPPPPGVASAPVLATPGDAHAVTDFWRQITEFDNPAGADLLAQELQAGARAIAIIRATEAPHPVLATASLVCETSHAAMLVAVATHPDWRGRGLATACLHELLHRLRGRGKVGCLFYDNPRAGRIYQRFGFAPLRGWSYVRF